MIDRVVLSHPAALSGWGRMQIDTTHFRAWLRRTHDGFEIGERFEEFADVGCCGDALYVPFVVEEVEGSGAVTAETDVEYVEREGCEFAGGWEVQSEAGP